MKKIGLLLSIGFAILFSGCSGNNPPIPIGANQYMVEHEYGHKEAYGVAYRFCTSKGKVMLPQSERTIRNMSGMAGAILTFKCVDENSADYRRGTDMEAVPNVRVEIKE